MKRYTAKSMILFIGLVPGLIAQVPQKSMFSDHRARNVGDVITILVVEYATASSKAQTKSKKTNDHGLQAIGGPETQAYSPMYGLRGVLNNGFTGDAGVSRQGNLRTKITASISEITPNGTLILQGIREVEVNGEKEMTTITGTVRPQDISWENTVYSYQLADVKISYKGKGVVHTGQKPGFLAKFFNWIF